MDFTCSGRVDLRLALARIRRQRPKLATITWAYSTRKSDHDLPVIEVPEGTVLRVVTFSGAPRLHLGSGRMVFLACSRWGNTVDVHGGELHVRTDGDNRKVTIHVGPEITGDPKVTTTAAEVQPGSRLYVWDSRHPGREGPLVVEEDASGLPLTWASSSATCPTN